MKASPGSARRKLSQARVDLAIRQTPTVITAQAWKRAVEPHLADPGAWEFHGKRVCRLPWEWVMAGVLGEGSGFQRDHVYVWALAMPLFVPRDFVALNLSERAHPSGTLGTDEPEALAQAIRWALDRVEPETAYLKRWARQKGPTEERAYSLALLGRETRAARALADARDLLVEDGREWALRDAERIATVQHRLREGGCAAARMLLTGWRDQTASALGLRGARVEPAESAPSGMP